MSASLAALWVNTPESRPRADHGPSQGSGGLPELLGGPPDQESLVGEASQSLGLRVSLPPPPPGPALLLLLSQAQEHASAL